MEQERTLLTAFFKLNGNDPIAHQYTYQKVLLHLVWDRQIKEWKYHQYGLTIGCLYFVSPIAGECFYLHTLLTTVKDVISWEDLWTFDGVLYPTFHTACLAYGLLKNNDKWWQCLQDASVTYVGESLCCLFSLILRHCQSSQPNVLWQEFHENICDNLGWQL